MKMVVSFFISKKPQLETSYIEEGLNVSMSVSQRQAALR